MLIQLNSFRRLLLITFSSLFAVWTILSLAFSFKVEATNRKESSPQANSKTIPRSLNLVKNSLKVLYPRDQRGEQCNATIVTAYFQINSKHSHQEYLGWMSNMLTFSDCLVVFTQSHLIRTIRELRPQSYPTKFISINLNETMVYNKLSSDQWAHQESLDPEQGIGHNRDLYIIWNEKTNFLKTAADQNFFNSSYFLWLDIGAVRHEGFRYKRLVNRYPNESGVLLLNVQTFTEEEKTLVEGKIIADFSHTARLGGGTIACDKEALDKWHEAYYVTFDRYVEDGRFVGKDQNIMATTCLEAGICLLVPSDIFTWFRLQDWFIGNTPNLDYFKLERKQ